MSIQESQEGFAQLDLTSVCPGL